MPYLDPKSHSLPVEKWLDSGKPVMLNCGCLFEAEYQYHISSNASVAIHLYPQSEESSPINIPKMSKGINDGSAYQCHVAAVARRMQRGLLTA